MHTIPFDAVIEDAVRRLSAEFAATVRPATVRVLVRQARRELAGDPAAALPELVERLARARIVEALEEAAGSAPVPAPRHDPDRPVPSLTG